MRGYFNRVFENELKSRITHNPVTALLGPRQSGKSTLAKHLLKDFPDSIYLDLENIRDKSAIRNPDLFFKANPGKLICIDEVQLAPELFSVVRNEADETGGPGRFLFLGSASRDLIRQSSETLAGRISYMELPPFVAAELNEPFSAVAMSWIRGGFPRSFLAESDEFSFQWRMDFIRTYLERDILMFGSGIPVERIERLWQMCAHIHGHVLNYASLASSLGISNPTVKRYVELLVRTFMIRLLKPWYSNLKKRLIKSPKLYIRDTGVLHTLLDIEDVNSLLKHPSVGSSWESYVLENIIPLLKPQVKASFFRSSKGAEIDLVLERGRMTYAVECKYSSAPKLSRGFWVAFQDIRAEKAWVAAPVETGYPLAKGVNVVSIQALVSALKQEDLLISYNT